MLIFGTQFNSDIVALAGIDPATVDLSTVTVDTFNATGGPTTVRVTMLTTVDSLKFAQLMQQYIAAAINSGKIT